MGGGFDQLGESDLRFSPRFCTALQLHLGQKHFQTAPAFSYGEARNNSFARASSECSGEIRIIQEIKHLFAKSVSIMRIGEQPAVSNYFGHSRDGTRHNRNSATHRFGDCDAKRFVNRRLHISKR